MKKRYLTPLALFFFINASEASFFPDAIVASGGKNTDSKADIHQSRLALRWRYGEAQHALMGGSIGLHSELGVNLWQSQLTPDNNPGNGAVSVNAVSFSPLLRWKSPITHDLSFFSDVGLGLSYQSEPSLQKTGPSAINMGEKSQFEIRTVAGLNYRNRCELSIGWYHYSNAHIHDQNEGIDFWTLSLGYWFE